MHEFAVVESVIQSLQRQLEREGVEHVAAVRFRRGSAFSEDALCQAYQMLTPGTPLEGAEIRIETINRDFSCACGHEQVISSDDLVGHMFVCPGCGAVQEIDEAHDLELLEVIPVA